MKSIIIEDMQMVCHVGDTPTDVLEVLQSGKIPPMDIEVVGGHNVPVARVHNTPLPTPKNPIFASRTNALAQYCAERLSSFHLNVAPERIGVVLGSSNAGIEEFHSAYRGGPLAEEDWHRLEPGNVSACVAEFLEAKGPVYTISTACSSSGKALAAAAHLLKADVCDVVIAGGADALCRFALEGFHALQLIDSKPCEPFMINGGRINHGEGAALFVLTCRPARRGDIVLSGYGETSDAHHTTTPEPGGAQAARAMQQALYMAGKQPADVDYINMHGTGTDANDTMELNALTAVFGTTCPPCSSTKPFTGHCLGAAGAVEAAVCVALLQADTDQLPRVAPSSIPSGYESINFFSNAERPVRCCMSNSFAFGGNNVSLLLTRHD